MCWSIVGTTDALVAILTLGCYGNDTIYRFDIVVGKYKANLCFETSTMLENLGSKADIKSASMVYGMSTLY